MTIVVCVAVGVVIDIPEDDSPVSAPLAKSPLDELAARLRREARCGRDAAEVDVTLPGISAWMAGVYQECSERN